jgi:hypothetical protein
MVVVVGWEGEEAERGGGMLESRVRYFLCLVNFEIAAQRREVTMIDERGSMA